MVARSSMNMLFTVRLSRLRSLLVAVLTLSLFLFPVSVLAASVTSATYSLTRQKVSTAADHEIQFVTPTGVDASSDTIILTYPADFLFGSVAVGDIDLSHGPTTGLETTETLAGSAAAGVWGVTIASNAITFTAPSNAASGEIAAGDVVTIHIGMNASGGANQITNPSSAQMTSIALTGTFGDSLIFSVPIISEDSVTVTATVVSNGGSSGGGGGGGDVTTPLISNVQAINISMTGASITWDTNEVADSVVEYGLTSAYGATLSNSTAVLSHQIDLTQLLPQTSYHFRVSSQDAAHNQAVSADFTFTTLGDVTPPMISNVQVINITDTSAQVIWQTDEVASSAIDYGLSTSYGSTLSIPGQVSSHSMVITGLTPLTIYHFFVTSQDSLGNIATSADATFVTTADQTPPANIASLTALGGDAVVDLSWTMPSDPDLAGVRIMRRSDLFPSGPLDGTLVYTGTGITASDLTVTNGVTYYYGAFSFDVSGNYSSGALAQATPQGPPAPPLSESTPALCSNGVDDDSDGAIDCTDAGCAALQICAPPLQPTLENTNVACSNSVDDDADGLIDCNDADCAALAICASPQPLPQPLPQSPQPSPASSTSLIPTQATSTPGGQLITISPAFFGSGGTIQLVPDASGQFGALGGSTVLVIVPITGLGVSPDQAYVTVAGLAYNLTLSPDGTDYRGTFIAPEGGVHPVNVSMIFEGGGAAVSYFSLLSQGGGLVIAETPFGSTETAVDGATVTLFVDQNGSWTVWNGALYGQENPQSTPDNGGFAFIIPNGRYYVEVEKDGYAKVVTGPRFISKGVFGERVGLVVLPPPLSEVVSSTLPVLENISNVAQNLVEQAAFGVTEARVLLQSPMVQAVVEDAVSPALLGVAVVNLAGSLPLFNVLAYLQYLFTQPILLLGRRRKKKWGVVYSSLSKQPVELAIVRLVDQATNLVVQTKVTDKYGRYSFLPKPGTYLLEVVKAGYVFPSVYLKEKTEDVEFTDLYHGGAVEVKDNEALVVNVPLDPIVREESPRRIFWRNALRHFQRQVALGSILAASVALIMVPRMQVALMLIAQIAIYLLFRRLAGPINAKQWGIVFDQRTKQPLAQVILRIFDKKFNKLLETQVTDASGKYGFFARHSVYYVTAEKAGYQKYMSPDLDLTVKEEGLIDHPIPLISTEKAGEK